MEYLTGDGNFHAYRFNKTEKNTDSESRSGLNGNGYFPSAEQFKSVWNKVHNTVADVCEYVK